MNGDGHFDSYGGGIHHSERKSARSLAEVVEARLAPYRAKLDEIEKTLGPPPPMSPEDRRRAQDRHARLEQLHDRLMVEHLGEIRFD